MLPRFSVVVLAVLSFSLASPAAPNRSVLAPAPDWSQLEPYQKTITREEFTRLLNEVYAPRDAARGLIEITESSALVKTSVNPDTTWTLQFAPSSAEQKPIPRFWRPATSLPVAPVKRPLDGLKIAIDPGHIGGAWAQMEERFFQIGDTQPVMEGEMTLRVAELLAPKLEAMGAKVILLRRATEPVTPDRPATLQEPAREELARLGVVDPRPAYDNADDPTKGKTVQWQSELLFYRISEIRHRATVVNTAIQPDLTICLHFNAEAWGDPRKPEFVPRNHFHVLLNGSYSAGELRNDDVRFDMLLKLLNRCLPDEQAVSTAVADTFARASGLPPYTYTTMNAVRVGTDAYVWARNLLANRLYRTPVLFLEPYVMNSEEVWERVQAGDYEGDRLVAGQNRKSIYREYADGVANGLRDYYRSARPVSN